MKFDTNNIVGNVEIFYDRVKVSGKVNDNVKDYTVYYIAACPPDRRTSLSGSGLYYANEEIAFSKTPNKGSIELKEDNKFYIEILIPSGYYTDLGNTFVDPTLFLKYNNGEEEIISEISITKAVPFRTLTYNEKRTTPLFYKNDYGVKTQENILRDRGYPIKNAIKDFWKPSAIDLY